MNYRVNKINSYNGWDPLKQVILGNVFEPEFFEDLPDTKTRDLVQQILYETHEDLDGIQKTMEDMGIDVIRTPANMTMLSDLAEGEANVSDFKTVMEWVAHAKHCSGMTRKARFGGHGIPKPCLSPRDFFISMGDKLLYTNGFNQIEQLQEGGQALIDPKVLDTRLSVGKNKIGELRPSIQNMEENGLPVEWLDAQGYKRKVIAESEGDMFERYRANTQQFWAPTVTRCGDRLIVDTEDVQNLNIILGHMYPQFKTPTVAIGGHNDGTFCTPKPGLVICAPWVDKNIFAKTFPGWDIMTIENPAIMTDDFGKGWGHQKKQNAGRWWHPESDANPDFSKYVNSWLSKWVGLAEESIFEVNMLSVSPNVILSMNYQKEVNDKLKQHNIEPVYCRFRHRNFWDAGLHCLTVDTVREGRMQNYFD